MQIIIHDMAWNPSPPQRGEGARGYRSTTVSVYEPAKALPKLAADTSM